MRAPTEIGAASGVRDVQIKTQYLHLRNSWPCQRLLKINVVVPSDRSHKSGLAKYSGRREEGTTAQHTAVREGFPEEVTLEMSHKEQAGDHQVGLVARARTFWVSEGPKA